MEPILLYLIQTSAALSVFYIFYYFLLRKEANYNVNRIYLVSAGLISLIAPLIKFEPAFTAAAETEIAAWLPAVNIGSQKNIAAPAINIWEYLLIVYFSICALLTCRFLYNLVILFFRIIEYDNGKGIIKEEGRSPFSFFGYVFLPENKVNTTEAEHIIAHELVHIKKFHSADRLFAEVISIIQWFNPFVYFYKRELIAQHELAADSELISDGVNINEYINSLLAYSGLAVKNSLTNNFNSLLKRRLEMIHRTHKNNIPWSKILLTIPLLLIIFAVTAAANGYLAIPADNSLQTDVKKAATPPEAKIITKNDDKTTDKKSTGGKKIYTYVDHMPQFPGGDDAFLKFLYETIQYPAIAKKAGIQGRVIIQYVVTSKGKIKDVKLLQGIGGGCDEEAMMAVKKSPDWMPGKEKGKYVDVLMSIPISFRVQ